MKTLVLTLSAGAVVFLSAFGLAQISKLPGPTESILRIQRDGDRTTVILEEVWDYSGVRMADYVGLYVAARPGGSRDGLVTFYLPTEPASFSLSNAVVKSEAFTEGELTFWQKEWRVNKGTPLVDGKPFVLRGEISRKKGGPFLFKEYPPSNRTWEKVEDKE